MRGLQSSNEWLRQAVDQVVIPPVLYTPPEEGWHAWAAKLTGLGPTKEGTHSGNIVASHAPGWAQWMALKSVLSKPRKELRGSAGAAVREAFEQGRPIPVTVRKSIERFTTFTPILRYDGESQYTVGKDGEDTQYTFKAKSHADALDRAALWFDQRKEAEVQARRNQANEIEAPAIYQDLLRLQLEFDGLLVSEAGDLVAMLNGPHGFYIICSQAWSYALKISSGVAAKLGLLSAVGDGVSISIRPGQLAVFAGLEHWRGDGSDGYRWAEQGRVLALETNNESRMRWRVQNDERALAIAEVNKQRMTARIRGSTKVHCESKIPQRFLQNGYSSVVAWAVWRTLRLARNIRKR